MCSLRCHLYREDSFACLSKTTVKKWFYVLCKGGFFPINVLMKANKESNILSGSNPLILSHSPDVRVTTMRQTLLCPQGHVCHCLYEGTQGKGWQRLKAVLCGWDTLPMHLWAGGDWLALHLPTAQTAHLWSFSIYMGISHARASMLQLWWCNPAMYLVTQCLLEQDGKVNVWFEKQKYLWRWVLKSWANQCVIKNENRNGTEGIFFFFWCVIADHFQLWISW